MTIYIYIYIHICIYTYDTQRYTCFPHTLTHFQCRRPPCLASPQAVWLCTRCWPIFCRSLSLRGRSSGISPKASKSDGDLAGVPIDPVTSTFWRSRGVRLVAIPTHSNATKCQPHIWNLDYEVKLQPAIINLKFRNTAYMSGNRAPQIPPLYPPISWFRDKSIFHIGSLDGSSGTQQNHTSHSIPTSIKSY